MLWLLKIGHTPSLKKNETFKQTRNVSVGAYVIHFIIRVKLKKEKISNSGWFKEVHRSWMVAPYGNQSRN